MQRTETDKHLQLLLSHLSNVTTTNTFNKCVLCAYASITVGLNHARNKANRVSGPGWKSMNGVRAIQPGIMSDTFTIQVHVQNYSMNGILTTLTP